MKGFGEFETQLAKRQYMLPGEKTVEDIFRRVAQAVAKAEPEDKREEWAERFYELMASRRFSPGGRVLAGAGTEHGNLLNCFVQGATEKLPHTLDGIEEVALKLALVTKVGGGNGVNLDVYLPRQNIQPKKVGGIAYLSAEHPDVEDFVRGMMIPSHTPDGPKQAFEVKLWKRVIYGPASEALKTLAREQGVEVIPNRPREGVIEVGDDMEAIVRAGFQAVREALKGRTPEMDLSRLRPLGSPVRRSGGSASGPVSFLVEFYENFLRFAALGGEWAGPVAVLRYVFAPLLRGVKQGGVRRGAGMATLSVTHPDLLDFITAKDPDREKNEGAIDTFNISVLFPNELFEAYEADRLVPWTPNTVSGKYALRVMDEDYRGEWPEESESGERAIPVFKGGVPARWLLREISQHAWLSGDPGVIFVDRVNEFSAIKGLGEKYQIRATNPCLAGETPVLTLDGLVPIAALADQGTVHIPSCEPESLCFRLVTARAFRTRDAAPTVIVEYGDSRSFITSFACTPDHPILIFREGWENARWVKAGELVAGDLLISAPQSLLPQNFEPQYSNHQVRVLDVKPGPVQPVYDLRSDTGTLLAGAIPIVVHNCGEIPLTVGEPCDLGALNLEAYVHEGRFDWERFAVDARVATRFLDDVLEVNRFALEDNRLAALRLRRLGLGFMGLADALIKMNLAYDSEEARQFAFEVADRLRRESLATSEALAEERGAFPLYENHEEAFRALGIAPRRNVALLTVAPTGTTSMVMGVSSGIEPVFSPFVWRRIGGVYKPLLHPLFVELMEGHPPAPGYEKDGGWDWDKIIEAIQQDGHGSVQNLPFIPEAIRKVFLCAHDVHPLDHVRMQGAVQRGYDNGGYAGNSLSKTINAPRETPPEVIEEAFLEAYRCGCKGITVYRDGSKEFQVLTVNKEDKKEDKEAKEAKPAKEEAPQEKIELPKGRPERLFGFTDMVKLFGPDGRKESFLVTVNLLGNRPMEVILTTGKAGDEFNADSEALGRVVSIALQHGVPPEALVKTLRGINGGLYGTYEGRLVSSKADLIAVALEEAVKLGGGGGDSSTPDGASVALGPFAAAIDGIAGARTCPSCGAKALVREEGCYTCKACGYSKCG